MGNKALKLDPLMKNKIIGIAILSALLFLSIALSKWQSMQASDEAKLVIRKSEIVHQGLGVILNRITQAETFSRTYILSGNKEYHDKVNDLNQKVQDELQQVIPLTSDKALREAMSNAVMKIGKKIQLNEDLMAQSVSSINTPEGQFILAKNGKIQEEINELFRFMHEREITNSTLKLKSLSDRRGYWNMVMIVSGFCYIGLISFLLNGAWNQYKEVKRLETIQKFMVNSNKNGVMMIDMQGKLVSFNDATIQCVIENVHTVPKVGDEIKKCLPPSKLDVLSEHIDRAKKNEKSKVVIDVPTGSGIKWFSFHFYPIEFNGAVIYVNIISHEITETRNRELQLEDYKHKTNAMLESTDEAFFLMSKSGDVELMNAQASKLLQILYKKQVYIGQNFIDFFEGEGREVFREAFSKAAEGQKIRLELPFRVGEELMWFLVIIAPVKKDSGEITGMSVISVDISERVRFSKAVMRSESAMRALIESMQDPFLMINKDHTVEVLNEPAKALIENIVGQTIVKGSNLLNVLTPEEQQRCLGYFERCLKGETFNILESRINDHQEFWLKTNWGPVYNNKGEIIAYSLLIVDVTKEQKRQEELQQARDAAERAERLQQQFLANMSHEIRTPLNGIVGMANLLAKTELNETQQHYMDVVRYSSDNLLVLINDILDLSKIKAGKFMVEELNFNIYELLRDASANFQARAKEKGLDFSVHVNQYIPKSICGDPHRLVQILNNLLGNALKFTEKGYIKLEAKIKEGKGDLMVLEFIVSDTGIGIAENQMGAIFEAFAQEEVNVSKKFGGTGLGLTISKHLVELQGGSMNVQSEKGKGSQFSFYIPYRVLNKEIDLELKQTEPVQSRLTSRKDYTGKRVLIVEDNEINQKVLSINLKQFNIDVVTALDGVEGVEILSADPNFDLVLLDLRMPKMDGTEVLKIVRKQLKLEIPVVVLTASVLKNEKAECFELGADDYMAKPFTQGQLEACLNRFLEKENSMKAPIVTVEAATPCSIKYSYDNLIALNDKDSVNSLLEQFTIHVPASLRELNELVLQQDWTAVAQRVHKLKSSFGIVYIDEVFELLQQVEISIKVDNDPTEVPSKIEKAVKLFDTYYPLIEEEIRMKLGLEVSLGV